MSVFAVLTSRFEQTALWHQPLIYCRTISSPGILLSCQRRLLLVPLPPEAIRSLPYISTWPHLGLMAMAQVQAYHGTAGRYVVCALTLESMDSALQTSLSHLRVLKIAPQCTMPLLTSTIVFLLTSFSIEICSLLVAWLNTRKHCCCAR